MPYGYGQPGDACIHPWRYPPDTCSSRTGTGLSPHPTGSPWTLEPRSVGFRVETPIASGPFEIGAAPSLGPDFYDAWTRMARSVGADPLDMAKVAFAETGMNPRAVDSRSNAGGLIGFMPQILTGLGWTGTPEEFRQLSATQQVPYVERYYRPYAGYLRNEGLVYTANFLPSRLPRAATSDDSFVVSQRGDPYYDVNRILDRNGDGAISVGDLRQHIRVQDVGARYSEIERELRARGAGRTGSSFRSPSWAGIALIAAAGGAAAWYLYYNAEGARIRRRTEQGFNRLTKGFLT
jgi:hypothetical protein